MPKLPRLTAREAMTRVEKLGYFFVYQKGSHMIYKNYEGRRTVIPFHGSKTLSLRTIRAIMKDINITKW